MRACQGCGLLLERLACMATNIRQCSVLHAVFRLSDQASSERPNSEVMPIAVSLPCKEAASSCRRLCMRSLMINHPGTTLVACQLTNSSSARNDSQAHCCPVHDHHHDRDYMHASKAWPGGLAKQRHLLALSQAKCLSASGAVTEMIGVLV